MKKYILVILLIVFITPSVVFASWWNPFSWDIFTFISKKYAPIQTNVIKKENKPVEILPKQKNIINNTKKTEPVINNIKPTNKIINTSNNNVKIKKENEVKNEYITMSTEASNQSTGVTYSSLNLKISPMACAKNTEIRILAAAATELDRYVGGFYAFFPPDLDLLVPAIVSITYNENATSILDIYGIYDVSDSDLTLAYFDMDTMKYIPIKSTYNRATKTVTGEISKFYKDGIMIIKKPN